MATNHTTNYALNLWEPNDDFLREEFNENFGKIDAALTKHDGQITKKADSSTVPQFFFGTYTGNSALQASPLAVSLGFRPRLLIIIGGGHFGFAVASGRDSITLCSYYYHPYSYQTSDRLKLTENGFTIWEHLSSNSTDDRGLCQSNTCYFYCALR